MGTPHFKVAMRRGISEVVTPKHGTVKLYSTHPTQQKRLFEAGFEFFHITPAGAKALYGESTVKERIALLAVCKTVEEVEALRKVKSSSSMNAAAKKRIEALNG